MYLRQFHWGGWTYSLLNKGKSEGYSPILLPTPTPATARGRAQPSVLVSREGGPRLPRLEDPLEHWNPWEAQQWKTPGRVLLWGGRSLLTSHCSIVNYLLMHPPHIQPLKNSRVVFFCSCSFCVLCSEDISCLVLPRMFTLSLQIQESAELHVGLSS